MDEQIKDALDALQNAHDALERGQGSQQDVEQLANYVAELQAKKAKLDATDKQVLSTNPLTNPVYAAGAGAVAGAGFNTALNTASDLLSSKNVEPPKAGTLNAPVIAHPDDLPKVNPVSTVNASGIKTNPPAATPYNQRGVSPQQSVANWEAYNDLQQQAANRANRATAMQKKYPGYQRPGAGQALAGNAPSTLPSMPSATPTLGGTQTPVTPTQKARAKMDVWSEQIGNKNPTNPKTIMSHAAKGAFLAGQGADLAQQAQQGNYGQAAADVAGISSAIGHSLAKTRQGKALTGIGMVAAPVYRLGHDLFGNNTENKAAGGVIQGYNNKGKVAEAGFNFAKKLFAPEPTKIVRASEALNPFADKGYKLGLTQTDNYGVHGGRMGGNRFPTFQQTSPLHAEDKLVWMNDTEKHAQDMIDRAKEQNLIWSTYIGAPDQLKSNKSVFNDIMSQFHGRQLTPDQYETINNRIATLKDAKKRLVFPEPFDIRDKFAVQELGGDTFARRGALADIVGAGEGVGKTRGGIAMPNYEDILRSHRDPLTEGVPTSSIGTQLFTVDPHKATQYSEKYHPDYRYTVHGENQGVTFNPFPHSALDWHDAQIEKTGRVPHGNAWFNYMNNPQDVSGDFLEKLYKMGHAEGGGIKGYAGGEIVKGIKAGLGFFKPAAKSHSQDPAVARALEDYLTGKISQEERIAAVNKNLPLRPWTTLPPAYTDEQVVQALMENKRPKALIPVPEGMRVGNRLDIPAYLQNGVYIDTTHAASGSKSPISYNRTGHLKDVLFESSPNQAVRVGLGTKEQALTPLGADIGKGKSPFARIEGVNVGTKDEEVRRMMQEYLNDPDWAQIGMDPRRHSQFYDKATGMPVWSAEEKLQSGPLVLVPKRGLETTTWDDPRLNLSDFPGKKYAEGGHATPAWQRSEGKNPEGGLNAIGRASYNRETGGNLKAPQPEGGPRKKSFCARMEGMKKKNTSAKTANDPDSRINKSLRKWKC